jgi:methyl-accepting chemotaxis protein
MPNHQKPIEKFAIRATAWVGSTSSLIAHTILFLITFLFIFFGAPIDKVLLILTTLVSLEAIYLSIFIQMSVNRSNRRLSIVKRELDEIHEDVEDIQGNVEIIGEDIDEIQKDVEEIQEDVEGIQEDVEEIEKEVDELGAEVEDLSEGIDEDEIADRARDEALMQKVELTLSQLMQELQELKNKPAKAVRKTKSESK